MSFCRLSSACINDVDEEFGSHFWSAGIDIIDVALYCLAVHSGLSWSAVRVCLNVGITRRRSPSR
jgi:hypothetical protein